MSLTGYRHSAHGTRTVLTAALKTLNLIQPLSNAATKSTNFVLILRFLPFCMSGINLIFFPPKKYDWKKKLPFFLAEMESLQKSVNVFPVRYKQIIF